MEGDPYQDIVNGTHPALQGGGPGDDPYQSIVNGTHPALQGQNPEIKNPKAEAFFDNMANAVSLGTAPKLTAGVEAGWDALHGKGFDYSDRLAKEEGLLNDATSQAPGYARAGGAVGSLVSPAALAIGGGVASKVLPEATGFLANVIRGGAAGAAVGAAQGAGESDSLSDAPVNTLKGALTGGVGGAAVGGTLGYGLGKLASSERFGMDPNVAKRLTKAGVSEQGTANMRPDEMLADRYPNAAYSVAATAGDKGQPMADALRARNATMPDRLTDSFEQALGVRAGSLSMANDQMEAAQQAAAAPLFQRARNVGPVTDPAATDVFKRPLWDAALRMANEDAVNKTGNPLPFTTTNALAQQGVSPQAIAAKYGADAAGLDFDTFQSVKRIARQAISAGYDENASMQSANRARAAWPTFQNWVKQVYAARPEWQQANEVYAGHEALQDALSEGAKDFSTVKAAEPYDIKEKLFSMGASERQAYVKGALSKIQQNIQSIAGTENGSANIPRQGGLSSVLGRDKLQALALGTGKNSQSFMDAIDQMTGEQNTYRQVVQGSQTASRQQAIKAFGAAEGPGLADVAEMHVSPHRYAFNKLAEMARGGRQSSAQQAAVKAVPMMTATGPDLQRILGALAQRNNTMKGVQALQGALAAMGAGGANTR